MRGQALSPSWTKQWDGRKEKSRKKEEEKKRVLERETPPSLKISRRSDRRFQAKQDEEFILTARASHRDRSWGVLTKTQRGRVFSYMV